MATTALRLLPPVSERVRDKPCLEHFGPALVTAVLGSDLELETPAGYPAARRWAQLAIAVAYQPRVNDLVLAIGTADEWYVVGVLEGHGPTVLNAPGDLELRAPNGAIQITAAEGCVVAGPTVRVAANTLDLIGDRLNEEFETVRRRITGMLEVRAKAICTAVTETWRLAARRVIGRGEDSVTIDAPSINLG
jgi:hypothetical protein